jgi:hypothetical protein
MIKVRFLSLPVAAAASLLGGCNQSTAPGASQPVAFRLAAASSAAPATMGALTLTSFRLSVGEASLGSGNEFGCKDCQGDQPAVAPAVVDVPLDGRAVDIATEQVQPGSYSTVELGVVRLPAGTPGWPVDATIEIKGNFGGQAFTLPLTIEGTFQEQLAAPVVVGTGGTPATVAVNITLPVSSWFGSSSAPLDPGNATQRVQIEANARHSFAAPEAGSPESGSEK